MWSYGGGPGWFGWLMTTVAMLAFWGLLVFGGVAVFRNVRRDSGGTRSGGDEAMRLLEERFARGEIDAEEFTRRRELLRSGR
ncbi:SHOCT domain-containing protein [Terrabacter lapilli]